MRKNSNKPRSMELYSAMMNLKTPEECKKFLDDLCSITELLAMEQRFEVAYLLNQGMIYSTIMEQTGASSAIISRVNRSLRYGAGGYGIVFGRMEEQDGEAGGEE